MRIEGGVSVDSDIGRCSSWLVEQGCTGCKSMVSHLFYRYAWIQSSDGA